MSDEAVRQVTGLDAVRAADLPDARVRVLFFEQFGAMVALARLMGSDDPEDTAQEAFFRVHSRLVDLAPGAVTLAYLRRIVVNLSRNRVRHLSVVRRHTDREHKHADSAEADAINGVRAGRVLAAVHRLPTAQRAAIVLRYWADLPYDDIAVAMACPTSTARSHVRRGMQSLATTLEDEKP